MNHQRQQRTILVIGGGMTGITAALEAAEAGHIVHLVEKEACLGGMVAKWGRYFPKLCPPYCGLELNFARIRKNPNIHLYLDSEITECNKKGKDWTVKIKTAPQRINSNCTACGECATVCPVEVPDRFNEGLSAVRAAYLPHELAFPYRYHIDREACPGTSCSKCVEVCAYDAIRLDAKSEISRITVDAIILATGFEGYDAHGLTDLAYGKSPDILTNIEMERLLAPGGPTEGKILKSSSRKSPTHIAFVQCAGSRDENHLPYCSAVCCSASLKHALLAAEQDEQLKVSIYYIDLRVTGRNEDFLEKVRAHPRIDLIKGKASRISVGDDRLIVSVEDIEKGRKTEAVHDMVVLATGMVPRIPNAMNLSLKEGGFALQDEPSLIPAGCCKDPSDVASSVRDATAAALKAIQTAMVPA